MKTIGCFRHLLLLFCLFYGNLLMAQTTWTGEVNSNWTYPPNWTAGVPDASDDVVIPNVATPPIINGATNNAMANSIHVQPSAKLTIFPGGQLFVDGDFGLPPYSTWAIFNEGTIENSGNLNILPSPTPRYTSLKTYGTLKNLAGEINVEGYTDIGIDNNGLFENSSEIYVAGPANATEFTLGFRNTFTFLNHVCATFHSVETVQNTTSNFNNIGYFRIDDPNPIDNGGYITNSGILELPQADQFSPSSEYVTNNEIIVSPTSFSGCGPVSPSLLLGGFIDYTVDGIFSDAAATVSAGTYNINTNTFTANPILGAGTHTLYFKISINNCTHIVSWKLTISSFTNCPAGTRVWTGAVNNDWNNGCNWSPQCVPTANDAVVINNVANDPVINTVDAVALSVSMYPGAMLTIQNTGQLDINDSAPFDGVILQGATIINQGTLNIGQNGNNIARHGILMIFNTNNSVFTNDGGTVNIDNTTNHGIQAQGNSSFENKNAGIINIGQTGNIGESGINVIVNSTFINDASTINIDRTTFHGIVVNSNASFTNKNSGQVDIGQTANIGASGIVVIQSNVTNDGATIKIDRTTVNGIFSIQNATFYNKNNGQVNIGQTGNIGSHGVSNIIASSFINDNAALTIDQTSSDGIEQNGGAMFENKNNGQVNIGQVGSIGRFGVNIFNPNSIFRNDNAGLKIDNTVENGLILNLSASFVNENGGQVQIGQASPIGAIGLAQFNSSSFTNDGATLNIDQSTLSMLFLQNSANFENKNNAQAHIGQIANIGSFGVVAIVSSTITNDNSTIRVDRTSSDGIQVAGSSVLNNQNNAQILLGQTALINDDGVEINGNCTFNNDNASLIINNTNGEGLKSVFNSTVNNKNSAKITIGPSLMPQSSAIENWNTFNNFECAVVEIYDDLDNTDNHGNPGSIFNNGLFRINTNQPSNAGNFNNNGLLEIVQLPLLPITVNNGIVVAPTVGECTDISPAFNLPGPDQFIDLDILGVFTDANATQSAGIYNVNTNTFTPNSLLAEGSMHTFFVKIEYVDFGCSRILEWNLTIDDVTPPTFTCPPTQVVNTNAGSCEGSVPDLVGMVNDESDNCGSVALGQSVPLNTNFMGQTSVTITADDGNGNQNATPCVVTVTVTDNEPPVAICPATIPDVVLDASGNGTLPANIGDGSSTDNCSAVESSPAMNFTCADLGPHTVTLTVTDGTNMVNTDCSFNVVDNTAPTAICPSSIPGVVLDASGNGTLPANIGDGSSTDNCSVVETSPAMNLTCADLGPQVVTLTVTDGTNMVTKNCSFNVVDNTAPTAICPSSIPDVVLDASGNGTLPANIGDGSSTDNCSAVESSPAMNFTCADLGLQMVTLTVTDGTNMVSKNCSFNVVDNEKPTALCKTTTVYLDVNGMANITPADVDGGSNDNCDFTLSLDEMNFTCADVPSANVTLTIIDESDNSHSCSATVNVVDNEHPSALCQNATIQLDADGMTELVVSQIDNGSSDACGIATRTLNTTSFDCENIGENTVVLTVTDVNGNPSTCMATVTVEDSVNPSVSCQNISIQLDETGNASIVPEDVFANGDDNCGMVNLVSVSPSQFSCPTIGANMVTLTIDDGHGNIATCTATVTVEDFFTSFTISASPETCSMGNGTISASAAALGGQLAYSIDGGATWQFSGEFTDLTAGIYEVIVQANGTSGCSAPGITVEVSQEGSPVIWYKDYDGDGFTDGTTLTQCAQPTGFVSNALPGDCNDYDAGEYPGQVWFEDMDGDGYGTGFSVIACARPLDFYLLSEMIASSGDCDDENHEVNPGAVEICNGIDDDCDGQVDEDTAGGLTFVGNVYFANQAQVDDFSQCYSVINGNLTIQNSGVNDLSNLINLTEVTGNVYIKSTGLSDLNGLETLATIGGYLRIQSNNSLVTLDGLENVTSVGGYLKVYYNNILTDCCAIHDLLANGGVGGSISIFRNDTGCDNVSEIENNCAAGNNLMAPPESGSVNEQACSDCGIFSEKLEGEIHPNPADDWFILSFPAHEGRSTVLITDMSGRSILTKDLEEGTGNIKFDIRDWRAGTYIVLLKMDGKRLVSKRLMVIE